MTSDAAEVAMRLVDWVGDELRGRASGDPRVTVIDVDRRSRAAILNARYERLTRYVTARTSERSVLCAFVRVRSESVAEFISRNQLWFGDTQRSIARRSSAGSLRQPANEA